MDPKTTLAVLALALGGLVAAVLLARSRGGLGPIGAARGHRPTGDDGDDADGEAGRTQHGDDADGEAGRTQHGDDADARDGTASVTETAVTHRHVTDDDRERMRRHLAKSRSRRSPDDLLPADADETESDGA